MHKLPGCLTVIGVGFKFKRTAIEKLLVGVGSQQTHTYHSVAARKKNNSLTSVNLRL